MKRITSADLMESLKSGAMQQPTEAIIVTQDGADLFVVVPVDTYVRLRGDDRPSIDEREIPDTDLDSIEWNR